jgi:hypothetical protein
MSQRSDLRQRRAALEGEWSRTVSLVKSTGSAPSGHEGLRHEVADSWVRSLVSVDPARDSAPVSDDGTVRHRWTDSLLRRPVDALSDELRSVADDAGFVAAVTDESGTIMWTCAGQDMLRRAERVNFAPGGRWNEQAMGTNALSLALRTGRPSTVFSAEHLVAALHGWVCYGAPIHGPDGRILGVLDLSTTWDRSHPLAMSTVRGLVSAIEAGLRAELPTGPRDDVPQVRLTCMGEEKATRGGALLALRPRQLEILTLLALEPDGFSSERLRDALYGDRPVTAPRSRRRSPTCAGLSAAASRPAVTRSPRRSPATPSTCCARWSAVTRRPRCASTAARCSLAPRLPGSRSGAPGWRWPYGRRSWRASVRSMPCGTGSGRRTTRRCTSTRCA